jgi:hypothetical protein
MLSGGSPNLSEFNAAKGLNLPRVGAQETSRGRCKRYHPPVAHSATSKPGENRGGGSVRARHLDSKCRLYLILRRQGLDLRQCSINSDL